MVRLVRWKLLLSGLPLLNLFPVSAHTEPPVYELRCRGHYGSDFRFREATLTLPDQAMSFHASSMASGADGSGLAPGTCSWIDRPLNQAEPREVWFTAPYLPVASTENPAQAETSPSQSNIPLYLYDERRYWSFFVYNTNRGFFRATSYRAWRSPKSRNLRDAAKMKEGTALTRAVRENLGLHLPFPLPPDFFDVRSAAAPKSFLVLVDGLDEVAHESRARLAGVLSRPDLAFRFVVGSRRLSEVKFALWRGYARFELEELSGERTIELVRKLGGDGTC